VHIRRDQNSPMGSPSLIAEIHLAPKDRPTRSRASAEFRSTPR
jgi:hypothetical protein